MGYVGTGVGWKRTGGPLRVSFVFPSASTPYLYLLSYAAFPAKAMVTGAVPDCTMEQGQLAVLLANVRQHVARVAFDEGALVRRGAVEDQRVEAQVDVLLDEPDVVFRVG